MKNNNYSWNKTLKFSWGHIIAFVALVFISYVAYMGDFYKNGGDFQSSAIKVLLVDVAILVTFIGAQIYKGTDEHFNRSIVIERILICLCPVAFIWAMIPYNHFWTVFSSRDNIESSFKTTIEKSKQMFDDYERYSTARIAAYDSLLQSPISNTKSENDATMKRICMETLELQLQSQNTDSLKTSAIKWIDDANQDATVWNAFLIGNIDKISDAIEGWNQQLADVSKPVLSNEPSSTQPFDADMASCNAVKAELKQLQNMYVQTSGVCLNTVWTGIILFMMLLFPYFLQKRNTRATGLYSLFPTSPKQRPVSSRQRPVSNSDKEESDNGNHTTDTNLTSASDTDIYGGTF